MSDMKGDSPKSWLIEKEENCPITVPPYEQLNDGDIFIINGGQLGEEDFDILREVEKTFQLYLYNGQTSIPSYAFCHSEMIGIRATSIISIGDHAFDSSKLSQIELPNAETIGDYCFWSCPSLLYLSLPKLKTLGGSNTKYHGISPIAANDKLHIVRLGAIPEYYSEKLFTYQLEKLFLVVPDVAAYKENSDCLGLDEFEIIQYPKNGIIRVSEMLPDFVMVQIGKRISISWKSRKWVDLSDKEEMD